MKMNNKDNLFDDFNDEGKFTVDDEGSAKN